MPLLKSMQYIAYFLFFTTMLTIINPIWSEKVPFIKLGRRIITMGDISKEMLEISRWQMVVGITFSGLIFGLGVELQKIVPRYWALFFGVIIVWVILFIINFCCCFVVRCINNKNKKYIFFNVFAAAFMVVITFISGILISIDSTNLVIYSSAIFFIYYITICIKTIFNLINS